MEVEKLVGETGKDPGVIAHKFALISRESGIAPVMKVDGADRKKVGSSLQLLSVMGRTRDKYQAMNLI